MNKDKKILSNLVRAIKKSLPDTITDIYWFGSRASGEGCSDSDYDLLLVMTHKINPDERDKIADVVIDFEAENEVVFDIHYSTKEDIKLFPRGRSPFIIETLEKGILL